MSAFEVLYRLRDVTIVVEVQAQPEVRQGLRLAIIRLPYRL
jgi:hypothetical protein